MSSIKVNDQYFFEFETVQVNEQGQIIERKQSQAFAFSELLADEIELEMVAIPDGKFMMGSSESEYDRDRSEEEKPQHPVTMQPFFMGKYPVTQVQWQAIAKTLPVERELDPDPSAFEGDNLPIEAIYWDEAIEFCHRLSRETGRSYRLPTEAEWEYACRAGTKTPFNFGQTITSDLANYRGTNVKDPKLSLSGSYDRGSKGIYRQETTPVDTFLPNAFGLYDMHGNVSEWCLDRWHGDYKGAPADESSWISNGDDNVVMRGGSWDAFPRLCRSASRQLQSPERYISRLCTIGFRVVCSH